VDWTRPPLSNQSLLLEELARVDALLRDRVGVLREHITSEAGSYHGLFISDGEFDELLGQPLGYSPLHGGARRVASPGGGPNSRWAYLIQAFALSPLEADTLLLCLLPEIDLRYERILAYLQDDVTRKRPRVDLALNLFCPLLADRLQARSAFLPQAPLWHYALLVSPSASEDGGGPGLLDQTLQIDPRVVAFLLHDDDAGGGYLPASWRLWTIGPSLDDLPLGDAAKDAAMALAGAEPTTPLWIYLESADDGMAVECARAICAAWGMRLLHVMTAPPSHDQGPAAPDVLRLARREARLQGAAILIEWNEAAEPGGPAPQASLSPWWVGLRDHPYPVFWLAHERSLGPEDEPQGGHVARISVARPAYGQRLALWRRELDAAALEEASGLPALAGRYRLSSQQIRAGARAAADMAWQRDAARPLITMHDLYAAARDQTGRDLDGFARRIASRHGWEDLVLPADRLAQLRELCDQFKYRYVVYDEWGFGRQAALGRGLSALFSGPSGTGKTMAAEVIARELELDLFKIDLSGVVSKYVGETEKNLSRIFEAARDSNAILFFDEADALFGKRTETRDAHDRYANIEVSYLLQKIEEYDGVAILTTNLRQNLDDAFLRRLQFSVEFPFPDEEARLRIWQQMIPAGAPLAPDVQLGGLAAQFKFSGGSIRNVLLTAAFLAAREDGVISMGHLLWAARREFQKLGKLVDEAQFITRERV